MVANNSVLSRYLIAPLLLLVIILVCVFIFIQHAHEENQKATYQWLRESATHQKMTLQATLNGMYAALETSAQVLAAKPMPREDLLLGLQALAKACKFDFALHINAQGEGLNQQGRDNIDLSSRVYFQKAMRGERALGFVKSGAVDTNNAFMGLAVPVIQEGQVSGVLYGSYSVRNLISLLESENHHVYTYSKVISSKGETIASSLRGQERALYPALLSFIVGLPPGEDWATGADGVGSFRYQEDDQESFATIVPFNMEDARWYLVSVVSGDVQALRGGLLYKYVDILLAELFLITVVYLFYQFRKEKVRQQLDKAHREAEQASRARVDFLARMSHEIRTPMNAIVGMTRMALKDVGDPARTTGFLNKINNASRILLHIINDVLDMSALEKGRISIANAPFDVKSLLRSWATLYYDICREKGLRFHIVLDGVRPEYMVGDAQRLNQVVLNLLSNAVKFTPPSGEVTLRAALQDKDDLGNPCLTITVSDTGCGMDPNNVDRVLRPFEQGSGLHAQAEGSTGLGLAIVKHLVELMDGDVAIDTAPGQGFSVRVRVPFPAAQQQDLPILPQWQGRPVLLYCEASANCAAVAQMVTALHMQCITARTTTELFAYLAEARDHGLPYALTIMDANPNPAHIMALAREMLADFSVFAGPVVLGAYDIEEVRDTATALGISHVLPKPMFCSCLYAVLNSTPATSCHLPPACLRGKRVLLAEDNEINTEIAVELLHCAGVQVDCAVNGQEGLQTLLSADPGTYDMVLTDIRMPVMDGYDFARAIRTSALPHLATLPIIAVSANALSSDTRAAADSGMSGYVAKPLDAAELYACLSRHLHPE